MRKMSCKFAEKITNRLMITKKLLSVTAMIMLCMLTASGQKHGDVNGDNTVDVADINEVINIMLGKTPDEPGTQGRTLIAYYSYTGNVQAIVNQLSTMVEADVVEVLPAEEGLQYEANNYAIGSALISAIRNAPDDPASYPAIKPTRIDYSQYDNIIIATPLWWSRMAALMQTFLFEYGPQMADKNIAMIVSSASSGINSVVADAKRLIPDGNFVGNALWINDGNRANTTALLTNWIDTLPFITSNEMTTKLYLTIDGGTKLTATVADNVSANALVEALKHAPISYEAHDYGNFEKVGALGRSFTTCDTYITTQPGDIMLYQGNNLVIFYGNNSWEYSPIGKIEGLTIDELKAALKAGQGNINITLSIN